MSYYFIEKDGYKFRLRYAGKGINNQDYYHWECKEIGTEKPWEGGCCFTENFYNESGQEITDQDKKWAGHPLFK